MNAAIAKAVDRVDFGTASARSTGRDPRWPYVPVLVHDGGRQEQILGWAFATRDEAVQQARRTIAARRAELARKLANPRYRALRAQHGLPRDLMATR